MIQSISRTDKRGRLRSAVRIRRAKKSDSAAVELLIRESFREYESAYTPEAFAITGPGKKELEDRIENWMVWVAVCGSKIVGTVSAHAEGKALHIRSMAVSPTKRGKRIGKLSLARVENFAFSNHYQRLILNTAPFLTRAIQLYQRFGFEFMGRERERFGTRLGALAKQLASARS